MSELSVQGQHYRTEPFSITTLAICSLGPPSTVEASRNSRENIERFSRRIATFWKITLAIGHRGSESAAVLKAPPFTDVPQRLSTSLLNLNPSLTG